MESKQWYISLDAPWGGFAPAYWANTYASFGNRNQARAMTNIDMTDPTGFKPGPALTTLTEGTEAGAITTLLKHILNTPPSAHITFGIGGNKLQKMSSVAVVNTGAFPHTIDKGAVTGEDGESIFLLNGDLYYVYNHSGSAGDFGKYDLNVTFDDDFGSTVPTGAAVLANAPHPSVVGSDNVAYIANGRFCAYFDADTNTFDPQGLDIIEDSEIVDVRYKDGLVWMAVNSPNVAGSNNTTGIIYTWRGVGFPSFELFPNPRINGKLGAMLQRGSTMFVWYQEVGFTGGFKLGYVRGNEIVQVASYAGTMPNFGQVFEFNGMIAWQTNGKLNVWGSPDLGIPTFLAEHSDLGFTTVGAVATPFGTVMACSTQTTSFKLAQFNSSFVTDAIWKSVMYQVGPSMVDTVRVYHNNPGSGSRVDIKLTRDQGIETKTLTKNGGTGSITGTDDSGMTYKTFNPQFEVQTEFSCEVDHSNGSATNAIQIRRIEIWGHTTPKD